MHSEVSSCSISLPRKIITMETTVPNGREKERSDSDLEEPNLDDCQQDNGGKRKRSPSEERREERRAANRRSAMESRQVRATFEHAQSTENNFSFAC